MKQTKIYKIEHIFNEDGSFQEIRTNDGFNIFELLGILERTKNDIYKILSKEQIVPVEVIRRVIQDEPKENERFTIEYLLDKVAEKKEVRLYNGLKEYIKLYNIKYLDELDVTRIKKKIRNFGHKSESTLKKIIKELTENNESTD